MTFGNWVYKHLQEVDRSNSWLCRQAGLSLGSVTFWRRGASPKLDTVLSIISILSEELGINATALIEDMHISMTEEEL